MALLLDAKQGWSSVVDVIVVGSGASGLMAGVSALWTKPNSRVLCLEKSPDTVGGTTRKSGGVFWLPNNVEMTVPDDRNATLHLLARYGFPREYNAESEHLGLTDEAYSKLCQYYDVSFGLSQQLKLISPRLNRARDAAGEFLYDYQYSKASQPDNVAPQQRHLGVGMPTWHLLVLRALKKLVWLTPYLPQALQELNVLDTMGINLEHGLGIHLVDVLQREFEALGGKLRLNAPVDAVIVSEQRDTVLGVRIAAQGGKKPEQIGAARGVIFASGGFGHDLARVRANLPYLQKTGAAKTNTGDFARICDALDVELVDMDKIWGCEVVYEPDEARAEREWETPTCLFQMRGDSFFVVGPEGKRVYNEKSKYDLRARKHWEVDAGSCASTREGVFFLIGDEACVNRFASEALANTWPARSNEAYIVADTMEGLARAIQTKFPQFCHEQRFCNAVVDTAKRFNEYAASGVDPEFGRGMNCPSDVQWTMGRSTKNRAMFPLSSTGPYYALPLVASAIDTKGGPRVDSSYRVLRRRDSCNEDVYVDRLYAVGNCAQNVTGDAYISGGATLGAALVSGYVAGQQAILRGGGSGAKL